MALYIAFIIINIGRIFEHYDEFNHWAVIIKNMFLYNSYGTIDKSIVTFNEYPPFTASFQYILLNIKGIYEEDLIIISQSILYLSIIIPICRKVEFGKKMKDLLVIIPTIVILPLVFYEDFFANILVDGLLGILFAIGLFAIYNEKEDRTYYNILLSLIMVALALTKTTGVGLSLLLIIFKTIHIFIREKGLKLKQKIKILLAIIIIPIILTSAWYIKINLTQATREWNFGSQEGRIEKTNIVKNFGKAFFKNEEITTRDLSMFCTTLILSVYSLFIYKKDKEERRDYIYILSATILSGIIFGLGLLYIYLTTFTQIEAELLACYSRYMSTVMIAWTLLNTLILLNKEINKSIIYTFIVISIVMMPIKTINTQYIHNRTYISNLHTKRKYYTPLRMYRKIFKEDDKIFFMSITDMHDEKILNINKYELMGINIENESLKVTNDSIGNKLTKEDLIKELIEGKYTYLYIYKVEEKKKAEYKEIFKNDKMEDDTLYKVKIKDKNIILEMVKKII